MKLLHSLPSLLISPWVGIATLIRCFIIFRMFPQEIYWKISSSPWIQSTIARPYNLLEHVTEATAVQRLVSTFGFSDAYRFQDHIQLPPLVVALWQAILGLAVPFKSIEYVFSGILLCIIDLGIAVLLYFIGKQLENLERIDPWEATLLRQMPKSIQPPPSLLFYAEDQNKTERGNSNDSTSEELLKDSKLGTSSSQEINNTKLEISSTLLSRDDLNTLSALLYYASPVTMWCSGMYLSFQNVWVLLLLCAIYTSCRHNGSVSLTALYLAMATYAEIHYIVFLVPCALWIGSTVSESQDSSSSRCRQPVYLLLFFALWTIALHVLSYLLVGDSYATILAAFYGLRWDRQNANLGILWYFQMQIFHRFRRYFLILITGLPYLVIFPISLRLYPYPMVLVVLFWWLFTLFRPVPTLHDINVGFCFMLLCPQSMARTGKVSIVSLCALLVPVSLYILDCWLWLETGSGNANFIFFQCLACQIFLVLMFLDFTGSSLRRDKALRLTRRNLQKQEPTPAGNDQ